jgi:RES domain-containing protein
VSCCIHCETFEQLARSIAGIPDDDSEYAKQQNARWNPKIWGILQTAAEDVIAHLFAQALSHIQISPGQCLALERRHLETTLTEWKSSRPILHGFLCRA